MLLSQDQKLIVSSLEIDVKVQRPAGMSSRARLPKL